MDRSISSFQSILPYNSAYTVERQNESRIDLKSEIIRKSIHFLIALSPSMAIVNKPLTILFLLIGTLSYSMMEWLRLSGLKIPIISSLTINASKTRDSRNFIMGPVTLGFGALLALLFFSPAVASIAIYALAFGDGFASLAGKFLGKKRPVFLSGKSIEGSITCFIAVYISTFIVIGDFRISIMAASTAMIVEAMPLGDYDNLAIPVTVGLVISQSI